MLATSYIKVGIFLHIAFGAIMVTNSDIIPSHDLQVPKEDEDYNSWSFFMRERFWSKSHGTIYAIFCISLVFFLVLKNTILKMLYELAKCLYQKYFNLDQVENIFADSTPNENIYRVSVSQQLRRKRM